MVSTDQGTSDLNLGQPYAGGILGSSIQSNGIYSFFTETDVGPDLGTTIFYMPAVRGDGYYDGYMVTTTLNPYYFSFMDLISDVGTSIRMLSTQQAGGDLGTLTNVVRSSPYFFSQTDINSSPGSGGTTVIVYYKVRGYYVVGAVYETYVTTTLPGTNPTGHALIDLVIVSTWRV